MQISKKTLIIAALAVVPAGYGLAQSGSDPAPVFALEGQVAEVFGTQFVLDTDDGRLLVVPAQALEAGQQLAAGDHLVVIGERSGDEVNATAINRADGTVVLEGSVPVAQTPPQPAQTVVEATPVHWSVEDAAAWLSEMGFTRIELDDVEDRYYEFEVRDADGREIDIDIAFDGTVLDIDVDDDRRARTVDLIAILPVEVQEAIRARGIVEIIEFEREGGRYEVEGFTSEGRKIEVEFSASNLASVVSVAPNGVAAPATVDLDAISASVSAAGYTVEHIERDDGRVRVRAVNPRGELVRLDVDFEGQIYREVLVR